METKWYRTLISKTDLPALKREFLSEKSKAKLAGKTNHLFSVKKHYFIETESPEDLKDFFLTLNSLNAQSLRRKRRS